MPLNRRRFLAAVGPFLAADDGPPPLSSVKPDLELPPVSIGEPAPGRRVRQALPEYAGTKLHHLLYLPVDWKPGRRYPVIVEYAGNGAYSRDGAPNASGEVETSRLGYGISAGKGFVWLCPPYVNKERNANEKRWWGDLDATVRYLRDSVRLVCGRYGADPSALILAGFSRGAIATSYIGLHDDETAALWRAFIAFSHYDGVITRWPYEGADRASAIERLRRLKGRPVFICQESAERPDHSIAATRAYIESTGIEAPFTYLKIPFAEHDNSWVLRDTPARQKLRRWVDLVLNNPGAYLNASRNGRVR